MASKRTPYFVFCDEYRAEEKAQLVAELTTAGDAAPKVSVATVAKALGQRWKALSTEEREKYKELAGIANKAAADSAVAAAASAAVACGDSHEGGGRLDVELGEEPQPVASTSSNSLPIGLLKRIISYDPDVKRIGNDAIRVIALASELFLGDLCKRVLPVAVKAKRRTIKAEDLEVVVKMDRRLVTAGLKDVLAHVKAMRTERESAAQTAKENHVPDSNAITVDGDESGHGVAESGGKAAVLTGKKRKAAAAAGVMAGTSRIDKFFARTRAPESVGDVQ